MFVIACYYIVYKVLLDAYAKRHTRGRLCCYSSPHYCLQNNSMPSKITHRSQLFSLFSKSWKNRWSKERYLLQRCDLSYTMLSHMLLLAKLASTPHPTSTFLLQSPNMAQGFKMVKKLYSMYGFWLTLVCPGGYIASPVLALNAA